MHRPESFVFDTLNEIMAAGQDKMKRAQQVAELFIDRPAIPTVCYMVLFTA